jgi:hypothetical protein
VCSPEPYVQRVRDVPTMRPRRSVVAAPRVRDERFLNGGCAVAALAPPTPWALTISHPQSEVIDGMSAMHAATEEQGDGTAQRQGVACDEGRTGVEAPQGQRPSARGRYAKGRFVFNSGRDEVGKVDSIHPPAPVMYGVKLPTGFIGWWHESEMCSAPADQIERWHAERALVEKRRASYRRIRP